MGSKCRVVFLVSDVKLDRERKIVRKIELRLEHVLLNFFINVAGIVQSNFSDRFYVGRFERLNEGSVDLAREVSGAIRMDAVDENGLGKELGLRKEGGPFLPELIQPFARKVRFDF